MTPLEMIAEWRRGCSCAPPSAPEECHECTRALIKAMERALRGEKIASLGRITATRGDEIISHRMIPIVDSGVNSQ